MSIIISIIIVVLLTLLSSAFGIIIVEVPSSSDVHFGLITICSIFGGFLYTNYNMLIDFSETELAQKVRNTNILLKRDKHIVCGIISSIISILSGVALSITYSKEFVSVLGAKIPSGAYLLYISEITFMFNTVILFILSLGEMKQIMKVKISPNNKMNEETLNKVKQQLNIK